MTTPIPARAMPAVKLIREKVKRPRALPKSLFRKRGSAFLRFGRHRYCPLGLLPNATSHAPGYPRDTGEKIGERAVHSFIRWWDSQPDPRAAVDAVWPREEG